MDEAVASELEQIKTRLAAIADEREHLDAEEADRREELADEEHKLEIRLAELENHLAEEDVGDAEQQAAAQTDLTSSPKLPDTGPND